MRLATKLTIAITVVAGLSSCGGEADDDARVCVVSHSFVRAEAAGDTTRSADDYLQLVYQGNLDGRCVRLIEGATGGYSYTVGASSATADVHLRQVDFGSSRTETFPRTSAFQGSDGSLAVTVDHTLDSPSEKSSDKAVSSKRYALPWLDGSRSFEVRFDISPSIARESYPSGVTITMRLPPVGGG